MEAFYGFPSIRTEKKTGKLRPIMGLTRRRRRSTWRRGTSTCTWSLKRCGGEVIGGWCNLQGLNYLSFYLSQCPHRHHPTPAVIVFSPYPCYSCLPETLSCVDILQHDVALIVRHNSREVQNIPKYILISLINFLFAKKYFKKDQLRERKLKCRTFFLHIWGLHLIANIRRFCFLNE